MKRITLFFAILAALAGCSDRNSQWATRWPEKSHLTDSITDRIERHILLGYPTAEIVADIRHLDSIGDDPARVQYFTARVLRTIDPSRARDILYTLLARGEEIPEYHRRRAAFELTHYQDDPTEAYRAYNELLEWFSSRGDRVMTAGAYNNIGLILTHVGSYNAAEEHLLRALDLYEEAGLQDLRLRMNINLESLYRSRGDTLRADSVAEAIIAGRSQVRDTVTLETILRNRFLSSREVAYLRDAIALVDSDAKYAPIKVLDYSLLSQHYAIAEDEAFAAGRQSERAWRDSLIWLAHTARDLAATVPLSIDTRSILHRQMAVASERSGDRDSALYYIQRFMLDMDTILHRNNASTINSLESARRFEQMREESNARRVSERYRWLLLVAGLVIVAGGSIWLINRRHQRENLQRVTTRLELERNTRQLAAKTLAMEEKDKLLREMKTGLQDIVKGNGDAATARELETLIRVHMAGDEEWQNFAELFEKVNPGFVRSLKERCPDLAEAYAKLAMYIYSGLTNNQIARLLNIRQESVRQARWRLRRKLRIPADLTIEDYLRALGG